MLAGVSALGSAAVHMLVPGLPALADDLAVSPRVAQYAISFYLFGLAAGQLTAGPLADRAGRRPILIAGVALHVAGAALAALAPTILLLCAGRVVQALGAGAAVVAARVIAGDIYGRSEAGRGQARLMGIVLLSPAVAPVIGGFISGAAGWRAVLVVQAALALVGLLVAWRFLPETRGEGRPATVPLARAYARLAANRRFWRTALAIALCSSSLYIFLAAAPFILIDLWGFTAQQAGLSLLTTAVTAIAGTFLVAPLESRVDTFRTGVAITLSGALLALAFGLAAFDGWAALMVPAMIATLGVGIAAPSGMGRIVHSEEGLAGTAASVSGALQMLAGGLGASAFGAAASPSILAIGIAMTIVAGLAFVAAPKPA